MIYLLAIFSKDVFTLKKLILFLLKKKKSFNYFYFYLLFNHFTHQQKQSHRNHLFQRFSRQVFIFIFFFYVQKKIIINKLFANYKKRPYNYYSFDTHPLCLNTKAHEKKKKFFLIICF